MSTALAPKTSDSERGPWTAAHDYRAHGEIVDFVLLMTYEWGYSAGPPMAVSPLPEVEAVVKYAVSEIPASKIMLGQNLYGYDWTLPFVQGDRMQKRLVHSKPLKLLNVIMQQFSMIGEPKHHF